MSFSVDVSPRLRNDRADCVVDWRPNECLVPENMGISYFVRSFDDATKNNGDAVVDTESICI